MRVIQHGVNAKPAKDRELFMDVLRCSQVSNYTKLTRVQLSFETVAVHQYTQLKALSKK